MPAANNSSSDLIAELNRVKCIFQLRTIATAIGIPAIPDETEQHTDLADYRSSALPDAHSTTIAAGLISFHDHPDSPEAQDNHAR